MGETTKTYEDTTLQNGATNELLTSRMGLLAIVELMNRLGLANRIDATFPQPGSNTIYTN